MYIDRAPTGRSFGPGFKQIKTFDTDNIKNTYRLFVSGEMGSLHYVADPPARMTFQHLILSLSRYRAIPKPFQNSLEI